ncbi:MAG TPA: hypothetical protein VE197_09215, partial [Mycobacterium sp.]|nr:hypothetical protein [Mycobacterium sp.]
VVLAAHAGKPYHSFRRILWIADLAAVADPATGGAAGGLEWELVAQRARQARAQTVVGVALAMARRVGVHAPPELFPLPVSGWRAGAFAPLLDESWPLARPRYHLRFALTDGWAQRCALFLGAAHDKGSLHAAAWFVRAPWGTARRWRSLQRQARNRGGRNRLPGGPHDSPLEAQRQLQRSYLP